MKLKFSELKRLIAEELIRLNEGDSYIVRRGDKLFTVSGDVEIYYGPADKYDDLEDGEVVAITGGTGKESSKYTDIAGSQHGSKRKRLFADY